MSENLMCPAHKTNSKTYRDEYARIFKKGNSIIKIVDDSGVEHAIGEIGSFDITVCLERDAKRCHRCNGLYWDTIGKDVCPYCGY